VTKKTHNRQLARVYARRQAERRQQQRKRATIVAVVVGVVVLGLVASYFGIIQGRNAEPSPSALPSVTDTPSPSGDIANQTGTVDPAPGPAEVACGAQAPPGATTPKPQFAAAPPMTIDPKKTYTATMQTSCGDIVIQLDPGTAPETVNSFVYLAEQGYFDGQRIHRLDTSIDVIQGGDPTATGGGGPGYTIPDELTGNESYGPGAFAMANAGPDTGGSQFFIITGDKGHGLDSSAAWTIFGQVVEGLDVAQTIQALPISDPQAAASGDLSGQQPAQAVYIDKVTIRETPAK